MRKPVARPTKRPSAKSTEPRAPQAFKAPAQSEEIISSIVDEPALPELISTTKPKNHFLRNVFLAAISVLVSAGIGLATEQLIGDLFARNEWLGWVGLGALGIALIALMVLTIREVAALSRLKRLDALRARASEILVNDKGSEGRKLLGRLHSLYANRPDMAHARTELKKITGDMLDGADMIKTAERTLMSPLDTRAKALTAAAARRVAIVTAISPRALVDIAFVAYESFRLTRAIAELYGARPGLLGSFKIGGAILSHLAVTGGVALGDSVVSQLVGHGLAARLSARLGEGLVNGLMSVRVGIAAMRVIRPLPFEALKQPKVMDFMGDLAKITESKKS